MKKGGKNKEWREKGRMEEVKEREKGKTGKGGRKGRRPRKGLGRRNCR